MATRLTRIFLRNSGLDPFRNIPVILVQNTRLRPDWNRNKTGIKSKIGWVTSQHWIQTGISGFRSESTGIRPESGWNRWGRVKYSNLPSFHLAYILICYCLAPTLFRVVASTHSLYLIITGTPLLILAYCYYLSLLRLLYSLLSHISSCLQVALTK